MYTDPALIRKHTVKLSLSDREAALVDALASYTGEQKAALIREMVLQRALEVLGHGLNGESHLSQMPRTQSALQAA